MNKILVILFIVLMLVGCGASHVEPEYSEEAQAVETAVSTQPPTPTTEPTRQPTHTSTVTSESTATSMPTTTTEPTATATTEPTPNIQQTRAARMPGTISQDSVTFSSNAFAENTGVLVSFQHPRAWQPSYFSDSGYSGWLISNADPNEAFWSALSTGEESLLLIMPVDDLDYLREIPTESGVVLIEAKGKTIQYMLADGEIGGHIMQDNIAFEFFGRAPATNTSEFEVELENLLTSFTWVDLGDKDLTGVWLLGTRTEGTVAMGSAVDGYVPMASISEWTFMGNKDDVVNLTITTYEPNVSLIMDIIDESGSSILGNDIQVFKHAIAIEELILPMDGTYRIQVTAPTGFSKLGPWNPPAEAKGYGWYRLAME